MPRPRSTFLALAFSVLVAGPAFAQSAPERRADGPRQEAREEMFEFELRRPEAPRRERVEASREDSGPEGRGEGRERVRVRVHRDGPRAEQGLHGRRGGPGAQGRGGFGPGERRPMRARAFARERLGQGDGGCDCGRGQGRAERPHRGMHGMRRDFGDTGQGRRMMRGGPGPMRRGFAHGEGVPLPRAQAFGEGPRMFERRMPQGPQGPSLREDDDRPAPRVRMLRERRID